VQATPPAVAGARKGALERAAPAEVAAESERRSDLKEAEATRELTDGELRGRGLAASGGTAPAMWYTDKLVSGVVLAFQFKGKVTTPAMALLKLLPEGKEPLPEGDISLEELKKAAEARGVSVVELTVDRAVFDVEAAPEEAAKWEKGLGLQRVTADAYAHLLSVDGRSMNGALPAETADGDYAQAEALAKRAVTNRVIFVRETTQK